MKYHLLSGIGVLTASRPKEITPDQPVTLSLSPMPKNAKLYINKGKVTRSFTSNGKGGYTVSKDGLEDLLADKKLVKIDLSVITDKPPFSVWNLGSLCLARLDSGDILCYPDLSELQDVVANQCIKLDKLQKLTTEMSARISKLESIFDGNYITE